MDHPTSPPLLDLGSFSYSWPTNKPHERGDDTDTYPARQCSFDFSPPPFECSEQAAAMADADQMFRDGLLLPLRVVQGSDVDYGGGAAKQDAIPALLRSCPVDSSQRMASNAVLRVSTKLRLPSFGRCGRVLPRRLSFKYLRFLAPLYQKMVSCVGRSTARQASARAGDDCRNCKVCEVGADEAIRDAILHCKKSL